MTPLSFGFSPCPNDTFAFHALVAGLIDSSVRVEPVMEDIETLNRLAQTGELQVTKLSIGALAATGGRYVPLSSGAALGRGVGPLVVAREALTLDEAAAGPIAIPGNNTTAYLLLKLAAGGSLGEVVEMRYNQILDAVERAEVRAGLIIHESRFTYRDHGLTQVVDLGEWWEAQTEMPVPLAVICVRNDVDPSLRTDIERAIRLSVQHAFANPQASRAFTRQHSQEMSDEVCQQHIDLYVNDYSVDLGSDGKLAVARLLELAGPSAGSNTDHR